MVSVVSADETFLSSFLQSPASVSVEQAAATIERIVATAATPSGAPKKSVQLAQQTLQYLFKEPVANILPHLLPICEREVSLDTIDLFVLCTAAWKAVTAAALKYTRNKTVDSKIALRIIHCASRSALSVLLRAVMLLHSPTNSLTDILRCVKIAKFYSVNAERCTKAFKSIVFTKESSDEFTNALGSVLRLVAFMSHVLTEQFSSDSLRKELEDEIAPLIATTFKSMVVMTRPFLLETDITFISGALRKSLHAFSEPSSFHIDSVPVANSIIIRIFAVIHLMRSAAAKPSLENGNDSDDSDVTCLRKIFHSVLCRILFESLDGAYQHLLTIREPTSGMVLLQIVAQKAAQCMAVVDVDSSVRGTTPGAIQNALLSEMSSKNPARATVASEGVICIFQALPKHSRRRRDLLHTVVQCGRTAYLLGSAHATSRWLPLVSRLGGGCSGEDESLFLTLLATHSGGFTLKNENNSLICDAFALRVVAGLCEYKSLRNPKQNNCRSQFTDFSTNADYSQVFRSFKLESATLQSLVKAFAAQEVHGEMTDSLISIIPYVFDPPSASKLLSSLLGKPSLPPATFCMAMNSIHPFCMDNNMMESVIQAGSEAIKRQGWIVCAAISAFVARSIETIKSDTTNKPMWGKLMNLLKLAIEQSLEASSGKTDLRADAMCGATMYHAVQVLSVVGSVNNGFSSAELRFPNDVLTAVEDAQSRLQQSDAHTSLDGGTFDHKSEQEVIRLEMEICRRGTNKLGNNELGRKNGSICEALRTARESSALVLRCLVADNVQSQEVCDLVKSEVGSLQQILDCATQWLTKRPR